MGYSDFEVKGYPDFEPELSDRVFTLSGEPFPIIFGGSMGSAAQDAFAYGVAYPNKVT